MTIEEHDREWRYRMNERLGIILESSAHKGGQRPATDDDYDQAKREVEEDMKRLEANLLA